MINFIKRLNWFLVSQVGLNIRLLIKFPFEIKNFVKDYFLFRKNFNGQIKLKPCFHDRNAEGGDLSDEYFWQDLYVANSIFKANPNRHIDVGSKINGFVAHLASFRVVEIFDIRPVNTVIPNVVFRRLDLMLADHEYIEYADSVSCLHALEHFGLGRYGDPIDVNGFEKGFLNIAKIVKNNGVFYLSIPIGKPRVEFNANRILDPKYINNLSKSCNLEIVKFCWINSAGVCESVNLEKDFDNLANEEYNLGIFTFVKRGSL